MTPRALLAINPVIPVMVITDLDISLAAAQAMYRGGIRVFEITLRTPLALAAIGLLRNALPPDVSIGAGTITQTQQLQDAANAGATFGISPGLTPTLALAATNSPLIFIPGVATASDIMAAQTCGFDTFKLFPAAAIGGVAFLKALAGPFADVAFCPTGGISPVNAADYLALPNVLAVGGSWLMPPAMLATQDWLGIEQLARAACDLRP